MIYEHQISVAINGRFYCRTEWMDDKLLAGDVGNDIRNGILVRYPDAKVSVSLYSRDKSFMSEQI